jgi:hypothetical protein
MSFVDLPGYAEARSECYQLVDDLDNGMGDTVGMLEDFLVEEVDEKAEEMGLDYELDVDRADILVCGEQSHAIVYEEVWEESRLPVMGATVFECDSFGPTPQGGGQHEGSQEFRVPSNGGEVYFDEANLRSAADFHS